MKIFLATEGSAHSQAAIDLLNRIPFPPGSELTLLSIVEGTSRFARIQDEEIEQEYFATLCRETEKMLASEAGLLSEGRWQVQCVVRKGHVADEICDAALETGADLVIVGAGGQSGLTRFLLGSVSQKMMKYAPCSVLVVRPNSAEQYHATDKAENSADDLHILLAFDDSPTSEAAVETLVSLPLSDCAEVSVLTVITVSTFYRLDIVERMSELWQEEKQMAEAALEATAERLKQAIPNLSTQLVESETVGGAILDKAKEMDADLIIMGHKGKSAVDRFLLGSVSNRVVHHAPRSVWIVR